MEKCCRAGQVTDNMAHAFFMLDTLGHRHTLSISNTYCPPTATIVQTSYCYFVCTLPALPRSYFQYLKPFIKIRCVVKNHLLIVTYTVYVATLLAVGTSQKDRPFTPLNRLCATGARDINTKVTLLHVKCQIYVNIL